MKKFNKKIILVSTIIIFIIGIYYLLIRDRDYLENDYNMNISNTNEEKGIENKISITEEKEKIIIYVAGAVKNEGTYELDENSRIADCIEKAGGLTEDANIKDINLAYVLEDGMKVYIPKNSDKNEIKDDTSTYVSKGNANVDINTSTSKNTGVSKNTNTQSNKININTANQTELETLPGIGPSTAIKIINYRKENGKFANIEDIKKVSGIGDSKYAQIKDLIKI